MEIDDFIFNMLLALALGVLLGLDREIKRAPVGIRAYALVCLGSAVYTMLTLKLGEISAEKVDLAVDPSRLIQGLLGGIGFLGAGAIIGGMRANHVRGIASGAAIWVSGGIGVACGLGFYWEAVSITLACVAVLILSELAQYKFGTRQELIRDGQNRDDQA